MTRRPRGVQAKVSGHEVAGMFQVGCELSAVDLVSIHVTKRPPGPTCPLRMTTLEARLVF